MQINQRIVQLLRQQLPELKLVYLFGFRAEGSSHQESD